MKIYLPKGAKGAYLSQFTKSNPGKSEGEFLLQRGTMLREASRREIGIDGQSVEEICVIAEQYPPHDINWRPPATKAR